MCAGGGGGVCGVVLCSWCCLCVFLPMVFMELSCFLLVVFMEFSMVFLALVFKEFFMACGCDSGFVGRRETLRFQKTHVEPLRATESHITFLQSYC